jgi:hypothetical protein
MMCEVHATNRSISLPSSTARQLSIALTGDLSWGWRMGCGQGSFFGSESAGARRTADPVAPVVVRARRVVVHPPDPPEGARAGWAQLSRQQSSYRRLKALGC